MRFTDMLDRIYVRIWRKHLFPPRKIGNGPHDCALVALYWAAPRISEDAIVSAFMFCSENWPYRGITNKEFAIALKFTKVDHVYCHDDSDTIGDLQKRKPNRCVALIHGHFIAIVDGKIVGEDAQRTWSSTERIYCYWVFH